MNRKHELYLINLGLESLLNSVTQSKKEKVKKVQKKKWTKE